MDLKEIDLIEFLEICDKELVLSLYNCSWCCLSIFRSLNDFDKSLIFRILYFDNLTPFLKVFSWFKQESSVKSKLKDSIMKLEEIYLISVDKKLGSKDGFSFALIPQFRTNLLTQIDAGCEIIPWREKQSASERHKTKDKLLIYDPKELNKYGLEKWENILFFIVKSDTDQSEENGIGRLAEDSNRPRPSRHIISYLEAFGLIKKGNITNTGYTFLLMSSKSQIWFLLRNYILRSEKDKELQLEMLKFILKVSFCIPGQPYLMSLLSYKQQVFLSDLIEFGIIYSDKNSANFYVTSLGTSLINSNSIYLYNRVSSLSSSEEKQDTVSQVFQSHSDIRIIVETNFKVYVYTTSSLHIEMLRVFLDIECILPNLVVSVITRTSIKRAFKKNIRSMNIIEFLKKNAHELCQKKVKVVPDNVSDQIILWEQERDRITNTSGILYEFKIVDSFNHALDFAMAHDYHVWSNSRHLRLFVREKNHQEMRNFFSEKNIL